MSESTEDALRRQLDEARQLLQVGVLLAASALAGEVSNADLQEWIDAVTKLGGTLPKQG